MQILIFELKRVIKSRMTWISLMIAIALSLIISLRVVSFAEYYYVDKSGHEAKITGRAAIRANKAQMKPYEGQVTSEKLQGALKIYQDVYKKYGKDIPLDVYHKKLRPIDKFLGMIREVYPSDDDYMTALSKINAEDITSFYKDRSKTLQNKLAAKYPNNADVQKEIQRLNERVKAPFMFYEGYTSDASDNLEILFFILVFICAVIVSPVFSSEYQSGSDDILRCTKHGKIKLAVTKLCSALLIVLTMFVICALIFVLIVDNAYGWGSLQTSVQVLLSAISFVPLTMGGEQKLVVLAGFLTILAVACFTLFLSSKLKNSATVLVIAIAFCLFPAILYSIGGGNFVKFLVCLFPAGGTGLMNSFHVQLNSITFIKIGSLSVWAPYIMIWASIVEIPLFFILSVCSYCRHQAA